MSKKLDEMKELGELMKTLEKRFDAMTSCSEIIKEDLEMMNEYMPKHQAIAEKFRLSVTEKDRKGKAKYGYFLARFLCLEKAFSDIIKTRCTKEKFAKVKELIK